MHCTFYAIVTTSCMQTHKHTHCSEPSEGAHQSGNAITQSKYSLPPLFSHTAQQSLKLPSVADQQSIHKQQQTTLATLTVPEDISRFCQEDAATGYHLSSMEEDIQLVLIPGHQILMYCHEILVSYPDLQGRPKR